MGEPFDKAFAFLIFFGLCLIACCKMFPKYKAQHIDLRTTWDNHIISHKGLTDSKQYTTENDKAGQSRGQIVSLLLLATPDPYECNIIDSYLNFLAKSSTLALKV